MKICFGSIAGPGVIDLALRSRGCSPDVVGGVAGGWSLFGLADGLDDATLSGACGVVVGDEENCANWW